MQFKKWGENADFPTMLPDKHVGIGKGKRGLVSTQSVVRQFSVAVFFTDQQYDEPIKMTYFDSAQTAEAKVNFECKQLALAYYTK
jgi:hypothetical protein